jgi:hypothetical protein
MLISFAQALLITELITGNVRILSRDTVRQQQGDMQLVQVRRKIRFCVVHRRPG